MIEARTTTQPLTQRERARKLAAHLNSDNDGVVYRVGRHPEDRTQWVVLCAEDWLSEPISYVEV